MRFFGLYGLLDLLPSHSRARIIIEGMLEIFGLCLGIWIIPTDLSAGLFFISVSILFGLFTVGRTRGVNPFSRKYSAHGADDEESVSIINTELPFPDNDDSYH